MTDLPPKLAAPARRALDAAGLTTLAQLAKVKRSELAKLHGMGPKAIGQLDEALRDQGLAFKAEV